MRRTGHIDKRIYVAPPDAEARKEILAFHLEGRPVVSDFDLGVLAEALEGYSARDIRFLVDEAAGESLGKRFGFCTPGGVGVLLVGLLLLL